MFCTSCGVRNAADSNFCKQCGKPLEKPTHIEESDYVHALPDDEQVRALLDSAYQHRAQGDLEGAIRLCDEALHLQPANTSVHSLLGQIALQQGDKARAIREYERVLQLNPHSIADRIKLEEIRSGKTTTGRAHSSTSNESSGLNPLLVVAACAGLLAVGWVMNEQWRKTHAKEVATVATQNTGLLQSPPQSQPLPQTTNTFTNTPNPVGTNTTNTQAPAPTTSNQPTTDGTQLISAPPFYPPVMLNTNPTVQTAVGGGANRFPRREGGGGLPPFNPANGGITEIYKPTPGTKVHLDSPDEKEPTYKVQIDMKPTQGSVAVTPSSPANTNIASDPTPAETRQALEAASNHTLRNDWDGAIRALKQAQKSPGSQSGKIHQDLAYCYQQKGNKATAKTYYEQAISEYEKQIAAGTQKELAESGIKACKRGIKACE